MGTTHRPALSPREHARLADALISECGGLPEASRACRVSMGVLSTYQNPNRPECNMPGDVIADLEKHCRQPIYSSFLFGMQDRAQDIGDLRELPCQATEEAADFQAFIRRALADGRLTRNEIDQARRELSDARSVLDRCAIALDAAELAL